MILKKATVTKYSASPISSIDAIQGCYFSHAVDRFIIGKKILVKEGDLSDRSLKMD